MSRIGGGSQFALCVTQWQCDSNSTTPTWHMCTVQWPSRQFETVIVRLLLARRRAEHFQCVYFRFYIWNWVEQLYLSSSAKTGLASMPNKNQKPYFLSLVQVRAGIASEMGGALYICCESSFRIIFANYHQT